jgi:hypothetical protein
MRMLYAIATILYRIQGFEHVTVPRTSHLCRVLRTHKIRELVIASFFLSLLRTEATHRGSIAGLYCQEAAKLLAGLRSERNGCNWRAFAATVNASVCLVSSLLLANRVVDMSPMSF